MIHAQETTLKKSISKKKTKAKKKVKKKKASSSATKKAADNVSLSNLKDLKKQSGAELADSLDAYVHYMKGAGLSHFKLELDGVGELAMSLGAVNSAPVMTAAAPSLPDAASGDKKNDSDSPDVGVSSFHRVRSPFVGTFYGTPAPGKKPYVKVGQKIKRGDVLGIVEAMKLMNEIESDVSGVVKKILVSTESAVEFNEALFEIDVS